MTDKIITNKIFSKENESFIKACETANVKATARQASKFRAGFGSAYKNGRIKNENLLE